MLKTYRIIPLVFILCLFGFTLDPTAPIPVGVTQGLSTEQAIVPNSSANERIKTAPDKVKGEEFPIDDRNKGLRGDISDERIRGDINNERILQLQKKSLATSTEDDGYGY